MLLAGDGARLKLGDGATLCDGATDWETMFVGLMDITGVEGATLTTGAGVGGLKTSPVYARSQKTINTKVAQQTQWEP